jgi:hypothetical protein
MKYMTLFLMGAWLLTGCSGDETPLANSSNSTDSEGPLYVSLVARVSSVTEQAETRAGSESSSYFTTNDQMGLVMDGESFSCWTYSNGWAASTAIYWPDRDQNHTFCAYYPYAAASVSTAIPMPDLSKQSGLSTDLRQYDFVAATVTTDYASTSNGVVKFTSSNALQHKLSLVKLALSNAKDLQGSTINKVVWTASGLTTTATYSFTTDEVTYSTTAANTLTSEPSLTMSGTTQNLQYICNPKAASGDLALEIHYTNTQNQTKVASTTLSGKELAAGKQHTCSVSVEGDVITIDEITVADWGEGTDLGTVTISGQIENTSSDK